MLGFFPIFEAVIRCFGAGTRVRLVLLGCIGAAVFGFACNRPTSDFT